MLGSAQPETPLPRRKEASGEQYPEAPHRSQDGNFEGQELDAALQLLVERAQYITGATGAALALTEGEAVVCRASAGPSAPRLGAHLQVQSGLTGESIARKQLLRCDNAETDPRVNLDTCRDLGIASIVVLPLLARTGEIRGLFELFSDHAYAFEERDLIALERMGELTLTALDLAERRPRAATRGEVTPEPVSASAGSHSLVENSAKQETLNAASVDTTPEGKTAAKPSAAAENTVTEALPETALTADPPLGAAQVHSALFQDEVPEPSLSSVPDAMRRVQKCTSCGFPVSEGRTLCLDCENKTGQPQTGEATVAEFVPSFLSAKPLKESWLANHVNILAVLVLILSIVVAVVVFR
jgi:hypothetical protein